VERTVRRQQSKREQQRGQQTSQRWFRDSSQIAERAVQMHEGESTTTPTAVQGRFPHTRLDVVRQTERNDPRGCARNTPHERHFESREPVKGIELNELRN